MPTGGEVSGEDGPVLLVDIRTDGIELCDEGMFYPVHKNLRTNHHHNHRQHWLQVGYECVCGGGVGVCVGGYGCGCVGGRVRVCVYVCALCVMCVCVVCVLCVCIMCACVLVCIHALCI